MRKSKSTPIYSNFEPVKSIDSLEKIFANRPLEAHVKALHHLLMAKPVAKYWDSRLNEKIEDVESLLIDSRQLLELIQQLEINKKVSINDYITNHEEILKVITEKAKEQIVENYNKIFQLLKTDENYENYVNDILNGVMQIIEEYPVVRLIQLNGYLNSVLFDQPVSKLIDSIELQKKEIMKMKRIDDNNWLDDILLAKGFRKEEMNRQMFRDIYDFLKVNNLISPDMLKSHECNSDPSGFIKSRFERLRKKGYLNFAVDE